MTKPYTTTTACSDAVSLALHAISMAIKLARTAADPVQSRLAEINHDLQLVQTDIAHIIQQHEVAASNAVVQATPGIPVPIANMLVNLPPQERIALDAAARHGCLDPVNPNDRMVCESLFRKGVFRFDSQNRFEIDPKYAPAERRCDR